MTEIQLFQSDSTTFKLEETWKVDRFSTLIKNNVPIFKKIGFPYTDLCTFNLKLYPNGVKETCKSRVSVFLHVKFTSNLKISAFVNGKCFIKDKNGHILKSSYLSYNYEYSIGKGFSLFVAHSQLLDSTSNLLSNDRLVLHFEGLVTVKQLYYDDLSSDLKTLSENGAQSDVIFVIGNTERKSHKAILSARSPVFAAMFEHESTIESKEGKVTIDDAQKEGFEQFLNYLYTGYIPEKELVTDDLLILADKYQIETLKSACEEILSASLTVDTVMTLLYLADLHNASVLKANCINFIVQNAFQVTHTPEWENFTEQRPKLSVKIVRLLTQPKSGISTVKNFVDISTKTMQFKVAHTWKIADISNLVNKSYASFPLIKSAQFSAPSHEKIVIQLELPVNTLVNSGYYTLSVSHAFEIDASIKDSANFDGTISILNQNNNKIMTQRCSYSNGSSQPLSTQFSLGNFIHDSNSPYLTDGQLVLYFEGTVTYKSFNFQPHIDKLSKDMGKLLKDGKHCDADIKWDGQSTMKAHQSILSVRSPALAKLSAICWTFSNDQFYSSGIEKSNTSLTRAALQELLHFIYTGMLPKTNELNYHLLALSIKFQVPALQYACETYLSTNLSIINVVTFLLFAHRENSKLLKSKCIEFIIENAYQVTHDTEWEKMEPFPKLLNEVIRAITKSKLRK